MIFSNEIGFNDGWKFKTTLASGVEKADYDDQSFDDVVLPHDWQIANPRDPHMELGSAQGFITRNQVGWYRKQFDVPREWANKQIYLIIDGCQRFYDVFLNEKRIGGHRYGYIPTLIDLTTDLIAGKQNLLCVKVDNAHTIGDRWYSGAGLYQGVRLLVKEKTHFVPWSLCIDQRLNAESATVDIRLKVRALNDACEVICEIYDPSGKLIGRNANPVDGEHAEATMTIEKPQIWDLNKPNLYNVRLSLLQNGICIDVAEERIGFRTAAFDGDKGFLLNGKNVKLYGANLHHDGGWVFGAVLPDEVLRRRLKVLKSMGCNAIRCSHNPQGELLYRLCDEMGFVVIDELYDKWCGSDLYFGELFDSDCMDDLSSMIARDRNHPCIILWSVGNEVEIQYSELFYERLREMTEACRRLDPSRPVSMALIGFCKRHQLDDETELSKKTGLVLRYAELVDVFMGNYMEAYYEAFRKAGLKKAIIGSEVFTYYRNEELSAFHTVARSPWADVRDRDYVAGGFVWAGVDYLGESSGWPCLGWTGSPVDSTAHRKLRSYFIESQWSDSPVLKLGFLDDTAYDDHANSNWGFPLMRGDWYASREDRMLSCSVMTNCDEVRVYLNDDPVRTCHIYGEDRMMHMLLPYHPGILRAEGWKNGKKVAEEILHSSTNPCEVNGVLIENDSRLGDIAQVDFYLNDEYGQLWERTSPEMTITVSGDIALIGVDNGNLMTEDGGAKTNTCSFHLGHACAFIHAPKGKMGKIQVVCGELKTEVEITA